MHSNLAEVIACISGGLPEAVPTPDGGLPPISFEDFALSGVRTFCAYPRCWTGDHRRRVRFSAGRHLLTRP